MFKSAQIRLTLWYVLIVMAISITFSSVVYLISFHEIGVFSDHQSIFLRSNSALIQVPMSLWLENIEDDRAKQIEELKHHLIENLAFTNLVILILSAIASYALAKRTLRPIEEMVEIQNRFTADASHEFRTPLTAMKLGIEVALRDKNLSLRDAREIMKSNLEEIDSLKELSNNLLELSQFKNTKQADYSNFSLNEAIRVSFEKVEKLAQAKKIKVILKIEDAEIFGDRSNIISLFTILLDNAIKYSDNSKKVWLNSKITKKIALITVTDEGAGIKAEDLPFIFNRFFQANKARNKDRNLGYGLGLAIAKRIIEQHHGIIDVRSIEDKGTTFRLRLPLK